MAESANSNLMCSLNTSPAAIFKIADFKFTLVKMAIIQNGKLRLAPNCVVVLAQYRLA